MIDIHEMIFKELRIHQLKRWHQDNILKGKGQSFFGHFPVLEYIERNPGCSQKDIAGHFALSRAGITKTIKKMLKEGVVERKANEKDERQYQLFVNEKGKEQIQNTKQTFDEVDQLCFKGFSQEELKELDSYFDRMAENLETSYSRSVSPMRLMAKIKEMEGEVKE